jgi:hypothetical protein
MRYFLALFLFLFVNISWGKNSPDPNQSDDLVRQISNLNKSKTKLLSDGFKLEECYRSCTHKELNLWWSTAISRAKTYLKTHSFKSLKDLVLKQMHGELRIIQQFDQYCKKFSNISATTRYQKMAQHYTGTDDDHTQSTEGSIWIVEKYLEKLLQHKLPPNYRIDPELITVMAAKDTIHGTGRITALKIVFLHIILACDKSLKSIQELSSVFGLSNDQWLLQSPSIHTTALPPEIEQQIWFKNFKKSIYFYKDKQSPKSGEFLFLHNGYSFGGSRKNTERYLHKKWAPRDCSDWLGELAKVDDISQFTCRTLPQDHHFQEKPIQDPKTDIIPGDILLVGKHHVAIIVGTYQQNGRTVMITLGYRRNLPTEEGLGLRCFWYETKDNYDLSRIYTIEY